jgi:gamma-glutamyl:cysteine ligase YbdK (ATP-grasp superfamily)
MGQEIDRSHFRKRDFDQFQDRLRQETALLKTWFLEGAFDTDRLVAGCELEAWLVDASGYAAPVNERFLALMNSPMVVSELAQFNVELNTMARLLRGSALSQMQGELTALWDQCNQTAQGLDAELLMIGILPTVRERELTVANMSSMTRYQALNQQILRLRKGKPLKLDIKGRDHLKTSHRDILLEAAATSFQVHLQIPGARAHRYYNAAIALSAPMVAVSANSPYFCGLDLWDETRIPLFEQAVQVTLSRAAKTNRVGFGTGYVKSSLFECFEENLERFVPLLPTTMSEPPEKLAHLRLHNGTIWRWNRPLIGLGENQRPHLRLEHRVIPAGPSIIDTIANAALFYGLVTSLATQERAPETQFPFSQARDNFYAAAKDGLNAQVTWLGEKRGAMCDLLRQRLLPMARRGLQRLDLNAANIDRYLGVIEERVRRKQTGACWQRAYVAKHGKDMQALVNAYRTHLRSGAPVHEWSL